MKTSSIMMATVAVAVSAVSAGWVQADDHARARELVEAGEILPLETLVARARKARPGRLLEAELEREDGRYVYEIELIDAERRVWELRYDARSGELIDTRAGEHD